MVTKPWYLSKTNWAGIIEFLIGALGVVDVYVKTGDYSPSGIILMVVGILTVGLRYITVMPIE